MQCGDQMLLGNRALGEVLLHQLVFALGHQFDQRLVRGLGGAASVGGNLADLAAAIAARRVEERLHRHQIHHAMKSLRIADGQLHRARIAGPSARAGHRSARSTRRHRRPWGGPSG